MTVGTAMYKTLRFIAIVVMVAGCLWAFTGIVACGLLLMPEQQDLMWNGLTTVFSGAAGLVLVQSIWDRV